MVFNGPKMYFIAKYIILHVLFTLELKLQVELMNGNISQLKSP